MVVLHRQFGHNRRSTFRLPAHLFRRALIPEMKRIDRSSNWATNQIYLAHFALTDVLANRFYAHERFARGAAGLAGSTSPPFQVWLQDWKGRADRR